MATNSKLPSGIANARVYMLFIKVGYRHSDLITKERGQSLRTEHQLVFLLQFRTLVLATLKQALGSFETFLPLLELISKK